MTFLGWCGQVSMYSTAAVLLYALLTTRAVQLFPITILYWLGYGLLGHEVYPVFMTEPVHTWLTPLVTALDAIPMQLPSGRELVGMVLILVAALCTFSVGSPSPAKSRCPFYHGGKEEVR